MEYRRYVTDEHSKQFVWQLLLKVFVILFLVTCGLLVIYRIMGVIDFTTQYAHYMQDVARSSGVLAIIALVATAWQYAHREQVSSLSVEPMTKGAQKRSKRLSRLFTDKALIDVLDFANKTRYGYEMPEYQVYVNDTLASGYVAVENIGNFDKLDRQKMEQKVSGLLGGKYQQYSVVSSELIKDDSYLKFNFEDVNTSHRLEVNLSKIDDYVSTDKHAIVLMDNLTLHFGTDVHHLGIIARTRSGKTVLAHYMATVMEAQGWIVEYNSAKLDKVVKQFNGQSDIEKIVERCEFWVNQMQERLALINKAGKDKYLEMPVMPDVGLFFDELGNLNAGLDDDRKLKARWNKAINRLTATGASTGIHVIAISQMATIDGLGLPSLARTNISDSVIMLGEAAANADERKYMMSGFADMPKRHYNIGQGVARFVAIAGIWSTPHLFEAPLIL